MDNLLDDFKNAWKRPNNALPQIIIINVVIFMSFQILRLLANIDAIAPIFLFVYQQFEIPSQFSEFIFRPWTILTYAFNHDLNSILHILFNMMYLYWFGKLIVEYLGSQKLINIYVIGAISGGALFLLAYNIFPGLSEEHAVMVGASGAIYAVTLAAATLIPNYTFYLMFLGPVRIKYIALFVLASSLIGLNGDNIGGNVAHLGGALMGYLYIKQLQNGNDWGNWITSVMRFTKSLFTQQAPIRVTHKKTTQGSSVKNTPVNTGTNIANQAEIDHILDKISQSGYESLSGEEKQKLFNASKNN